MQAKENKRTYRTQKASVFVNSLAKQCAGRDWELYADLIKYWENIVGKELSYCTCPVNITFPYQPNEKYRKNGTLTIKIPKGSAMEFSFKTESIKQQINRYIGYNAFSSIKLENSSEYVVPSHKKELHLSENDVIDVKTISSEIDDPDLRNVLEKLGLSLKEKEQ